MDLLDHPLPFLDEAIPASMGTTRKHTKAWAPPIAPFDGFIFVTGANAHLDLFGGRDQLHLRR